MRYDGGDTPICRECAGMPAHHVCGRCGAEAASYARGLCARCVLHDRLTELLGDQTARRERGLDGLFELFMAAPSAKDRIRWLTRSPTVPLLGQIASGEVPCTHEALDAYPSRRAAWRAEHLLVAVGALPARDPALARLEQWIDQLLTDSDHEPVLRPFASWVVLRRYRRKSQRVALGSGELARAKVELRSAGAFLDWLTGRGRDLAACTQADVDAWLAGERADRYIARQFARWAMAQKLMPRLDFPFGQRGGPTPPITDHDRLELSRRLLDDDTIPARDRLAGILVAVYAQPIGRVARLSLEDVTLNDGGTAIRFGETPITLPGPIADAVRRWLDQCDAAMPPMATPSRWLFPGNPPSLPIGELSLSRRLKRFGVDCNDARRAALLHLAGEIPSTILSDLVGVHVHTAIAWAEIAGRPWGEYPTLRDAGERRG
jgi:integrase